MYKIVCRDLKGNIIPDATALLNKWAKEPVSLNFESKPFIPSFLFKYVPLNQIPLNQIPKRENCDE